jgi:hypothetical protein
MRLPIVTEITQRREPAGRDTFIDDLKTQPASPVQPRDTLR